MGAKRRTEVSRTAAAEEVEQGLQEWLSGRTHRLAFPGPIKEGSRLYARVVLSLAFWGCYSGRLFRIPYNEVAVL